MFYLIAKALHIIGFTAWFSGLFYLGRIFVYHAEAQEKDQPSNHYTLMEERAYGIICIPAMFITWGAGLYMLYNNGFDWLGANGWMHVKLLLIILLSIHQILLKKTITSLKNKTARTSSFAFRLKNEVPTLFLFAIVFLAILKNTFNMVYALAGMLLLMISLYMATKWYKSYRENKV